MGLAGTSTTREQAPAFADFVDHNGTKDHLWDEITHADYTTRGREAALEMARDCDLASGDLAQILGVPQPCDTCGEHRLLHKVIFTHKPELICDTCITQ